MRRMWERDELVEHWSLTEEKRALAQKFKTNTGLLGFARLFTWFQYDGGFT